MSHQETAAAGAATPSHPDIGRLTFYRPGGIPDVHIMRAEQNRQCWRVFHEDYVLCSCRDAAAEWRYRGRDHRLQAGTQMLLEPGETHVNTRVLKPADFVVVWLPARLMQDAAQEFGRGALHFRQAQTADRMLYDAIEGLSQCCPHEALEQQSRLAQVQRILLERYAEHPIAAGPMRRERPAIEQVKRYIKEHAALPVTLTELAAVGGLSRFHLVRAFHRQVGMPPHRYQICVRVERARGLLEQGVPVVEAALVTGFADQSHLTRHFRATFGTTPARFFASRFLKTGASGCDPALGSA
ncbi:MAG TPA: AraC family transcriptional regulator [Acidiferrobacteraceae bacterium]|nr:AraC family transcriptional regulator [Acidiferrobacteraceae bacterium]